MLFHLSVSLLDFTFFIQEVLLLVDVFTSQFLNDLGFSFRRVIIMRLVIFCTIVNFILVRVLIDFVYDRLSQYFSSPRIQNNILLLSLVLLLPRQIPHLSIFTDVLSFEIEDTVDLALLYIRSLFVRLVVVIEFPLQQVHVLFQMLLIRFILHRKKRWFTVLLVWVVPIIIIACLVSNFPAHFKLQRFWSCFDPLVPLFESCRSLSLMEFKANLLEWRDSGAFQFICFPSSPSAHNTSPLFGSRAWGFLWVKRQIRSIVAIGSVISRIKVQPRWPLPHPIFQDHHFWSIEIITS
jgi:hypothetical protein